MKNVIIPKFREYSSNGNSLKRTNHIDAVKISVSGNTGWISYRNTADFMIENETVNKMKWIESAVLVKNNGIWKITLLHSSVLKEYENKK